MKPITSEQAIKLTRRHWKTIADLLSTHPILDLTSDQAMTALSNYLNAVKDLDKLLEVQE